MILEVLDARDPLGSRCQEMEDHILSSSTDKRLVLVLNKIGKTYSLTLCLLGNFSDFFVVCCCFCFSKLTYSKNSFRNTIRVSNSLDPDQARHFVGTDLGPNCLQMLSADNISRQRVKMSSTIRSRQYV